MAIEFHYEKDRKPMKMMTSQKRWYLSADGRAVGEGDPDAATLLVGAGCEIEEETMRRHGIHPEQIAEAEAARVAEAEAAAEAARVAEAEAAAEAARVAEAEAKAKSGPPSTKAKSGPEETK